MKPKVSLHRKPTCHFRFTLITVPSNFKSVCCIKRLGYEKVVEFPHIHTVVKDDAGYLILWHAAAIYAAWAH